MKESIGLILDNVIKDIKTEREILEKLRKCRNIKSMYFSTFFFHINLSSKQLKAFVKRNTDILFKLNAGITKQYGKRVFFMIKSLDLEAWRKSINNYRYMYVGNILDGLDQYIILMQNIKQREHRRNIH
jgi:hypothetical protein